MSARDRRRLLAWNRYLRRCDLVTGSVPGEEVHRTPRGWFRAQGAVTGRWSFAWAYGSTRWPRHNRGAPAWERGS